MIRVAIIEPVNTGALFALPCIVPTIRVDSFATALVARTAQR